MLYRKRKFGPLGMKLIDAIKKWYQGTYVPPPPIDPHDTVIIVSMGHYEQPLLAKILGFIGRFYLAHWKWVIGTTIAVISIFVAL